MPFLNPKLPLQYAGRTRRPGETFEAAPADAVALVLVGVAEEVDQGEASSSSRRRYRRRDMAPES